MEVYNALGERDQLQFYQAKWILTETYRCYSGQCSRPMGEHSGYWKIKVISSRGEENRERERKRHRLQERGRRASGEARARERWAQYKVILALISGTLGASTREAADGVRRGTKSAKYGWQWGARCGRGRAGVRRRSKGNTAGGSVIRSQDEQDKPVER